MIASPGISDAYLPMYNSLEKEDFAGKLVLLQPPSDASSSVRQMAVKSLQLDGLFMEERLNQLHGRRPGPLLGISEPAMNSNVVTNGGLISPQSEGQGSMGPTPPPANRSPDNFKHIDPSKVGVSITCAHYWQAHKHHGQPLHKRKSQFPSYGVISLTPTAESPPPCNEYYLMECSKGVRDRCHLPNFGNITHLLTAAQLQVLS